MSLEFTTDGLTIQTYQEIYDELVAAYQAIYGADINTDADSPDGQRIGIEAKARLDQQSFALSLYNQLDPDLAAGESLNKMIKLAGIFRQPASRSQVDITVTADRDLTLPDGYAIEDDLGQLWITTAATPVTIGANVVTMVAQDYGAIEADAGTITEPSDIIIGVVSVTNVSAATPGVDEETDAELRTRRNRSLENPATSSIGGMFTALGNLPGVTDLIVYENDTDTYDAVLDLNAHSIWCIVEGGVVASIIETIARNKTAGTGIKGSVTGTYTETLYKPDLTPYYINHDMAFDRPTDVPLYVNLTVEGLAGATVDTDAIKTALAAKQFNIAQVANASVLYQTVYSVADTFAATLLEISIDDITYTDDYIEPGPDEVFSIDTVNITITDITP